MAVRVLTHGEVTLVVKLLACMDYVRRNGRADHGGSHVIILQFATKRGTALLEKARCFPHRLLLLLETVTRDKHDGVREAND